MNNATPAPWPTTGNTLATHADPPTKDQSSSDNGVLMHWPFTPLANSNTRPNALKQYAGQPIPTSDHVLLCCFGSELTGERTYRQLRRALLQAGFTGLLARHIITMSPCLSRDAKGAYRLRKLET